MCCLDGFVAKAKTGNSSEGGHQVDSEFLKRKARTFFALLPCAFVHILLAMHSPKIGLKVIAPYLAMVMVIGTAGCKSKPTKQPDDPYWFYNPHEVQMTNGADAPALRNPPFVSREVCTNFLAAHIFLIPDQEVRQLYGANLARHFCAAAVTIQNTNSSAVIVYGDSLRVQLMSRQQGTVSQIVSTNGRVQSIQPLLFTDLLGTLIPKSTAALALRSLNHLWEVPPFGVRVGIVFLLRRAPQMTGDTTVASISDFAVEPNVQVYGRLLLESRPASTP